MENLQEITNFTPGPWCVTNGVLLRVSTTKKRPIVICGVHRLGSKGGPSEGDPLANARLIASAPDLYTRVQELEAELAKLRRTECYPQLDIEAGRRSAKMQRLLP